jgi:hypothetical protein
VASLQLARSHVGLGRDMDSIRPLLGDDIPGNARILSNYSDTVDAVIMASCGLLLCLRAKVISGKSMEQLLCQYVGLH